MELGKKSRSKWESSVKVCKVLEGSWGKALCTGVGSFCHCLILGHWESHLTSLSSNFIILKCCVGTQR